MCFNSIDNNTHNFYTIYAQFIYLIYSQNLCAIITYSRLLRKLFPCFGNDDPPPPPPLEHPDPAGTDFHPISFTPIPLEFTQTLPVSSPVYPSPKNNQLFIHCAMIHHALLSLHALTVTSWLSDIALTRSGNLRS